MYHPFILTGGPSGNEAPHDFVKALEVLKIDPFLGDMIATTSGADVNGGNVVPLEVASVGAAVHQKRLRVVAGNFASNFPKCGDWATVLALIGGFVQKDFYLNIGS